MNILGTKPLENVTDFTHLGITLSYNGSLSTELDSRIFCNLQLTPIFRFRHGVRMAPERVPRRTYFWQKKQGTSKAEMERHLAEGPETDVPNNG